MTKAEQNVLQDRLRMTCRILVDSVGASEPINAEDAAWMAAKRIRDLEQQLALRHPVPWSVHQDWTWEVHDADGALVGKFSTQGQAQAVCDAANNPMLPANVSVADEVPRISVSDEMRQLAREAVTASKLPVNEDEWAETLAKDICAEPEPRIAAVAEALPKCVLEWRALGALQGMALDIGKETHHWGDMRQCLEWLATAPAPRLAAVVAASADDAEVLRAAQDFDVDDWKARLLDIDEALCRARIISAEALFAMAQDIERTCPCQWPDVEPCCRDCTCREPLLSGGCSRCTRYGSDEQRAAQAARIAQAGEPTLGALHERLAVLRRSGWAVAVHNDYRQDGVPLTFWLLTHRASGRYLKGEGTTDLVALNQVLSQIAQLDRSP